MTLILTAWTAFCLGVGCIAAGGEEEDGTPIFKSPWQPLGWALVAWAFGVVAVVLTDLIIGRLY